MVSLWGFELTPLTVTVLPPGLTRMYELLGFCWSIVKSLMYVWCASYGCLSFIVTLPTVLTLTFRISGEQIGLE